MKRLFISALAIITSAVILFTGFTAEAANGREINSKYEEITAYLKSCPSPGVGAVGGDWLIMGLARGGCLDEKTAEAYYKDVEKYVKGKNSAYLHRSKVTENVRVALALTAIGKNPENVAGRNLLEPIADLSFVRKQGFNGSVWSLIALDSLQYEIPSNPKAKELTTRDLLIGDILDAQSEGGGWDINGVGADPDMTAMAVQALAPYTSKPEVRQAIEKALAVLSEKQLENGSFNTYGEDTPESCAQVIVALGSIGVNCESDERFLKKGNSPIDGLMSFSTENGFEHLKGEGFNQMATEQGYYALVSYQRLTSGKTSLYDMCDLLLPYDVNFDGKVNINDATLIQKQVARLVELNLRATKIADVNRSGKIDINDATDTQKKAAGYEGY